MTIEDITRFCDQSSLRWTGHILNRLIERNIQLDDVKASLLNGEIIEQYPNDYPYPSCLVLGYTEAGFPLHVVCGANEEELWLITAYFPNSEDWTRDFKRRMKK